MTATTNPDWDALRERLEVRRRAVAAEIGAYPAPITGCDAQFNHLTEERRRLAREIARLDDARAQDGSSIGEFIRSSTVLDETLTGS